jgi:hypothetical protein
MKNAWFMDYCASNRIRDFCPYAGAPTFARFSAREAPSKTGTAKNPFRSYGTLRHMGTKNEHFKGFRAVL